ncbi:MAG: DUF2283 domain-containing protein [Methanobrevibacter sp.]
MDIPINSFEIDYNYDFSYDILTVTIKNDYEYGETIEMDNNILLDFDVKGVPVSLEIINASEVLNVKKYSLKNMHSFQMNVTVNEDTITVNINFVVKVHNKNQDSSLKCLINNYLNIPHTETQMITV